MQRFDFETVVNRSNIGSLKDTFSQSLNTENNLVILSGAEMDFPTAPVIRNALVSFAERGIYGFTLADTAYLERICFWMETVRGIHVAADEIVPALGTIFALCTAMRAFTEAGDGVIIQHPSYYRYDTAVEKNGRRVISNPMIEHEGKYSLDFDDLEKKMSDPRNKMMILCNPHNPTGRVFSKDDLQKLAALTQKYGTIILSDEIFAEVTFGGHRVIPYVEIDPQHGLTVTSLGKVFNLTGVNHANLIIKDASLREKYKKQRDMDHFGSIDPFFYSTLMAGYSEDGLEWIRQMRDYVWRNYEQIKAAADKYFPEIGLSPLEGTFVVWMDFRKLGLSGKSLQNILESTGIVGDPGEEYGPGGDGFFRFNIATQHSTITNFLYDLRQAYETIKTQSSYATRPCANM